eukprot:3394295-Pyramimonas_sp.AAC.1
MQLVMSKSGHLAVRIDDWPSTGFPTDGGFVLDAYTVVACQSGPVENESSTSLSTVSHHGRYHPAGHHHEQYHPEASVYHQAHLGHHQQLQP